IASLKSERDALEEETRQLRIRALDLQEKLNREYEQTKRLRTQQRKTKQQVKQDSRGGSSGAALAFADPEQQFRHDIYMAWVEKIPAQDKARLPLPEYLVGEHFLDTLSVHTPDIRKKALEVVVEVLTGTAERSAG